jgi:LPS O-antigen subunit length determinant protein (WzzB/FepE family)
MVADEVVQKADELWHERINSIMKAIEVAVQNGVARAFSG